MTNVLSPTNIQKTGVVGAGQMGLGIAQVLAQAGFDVKMLDANPKALEKAMQSIESSLNKLKEKGKLEEEPGKVLQRIQACQSMTDLKDAQIVIEAVSEIEKLKIEIFQSLDQVLAPEAIIASNTSSLPITRLAAATKRPAQVIGMHWMNPVPLMKLVEIISGHATSANTLQVTKHLAERAGKVTVQSQDYPGFIVNRILMPMINEAFFTLMEGVATAEDIDNGMKLGTNQPMGPLALADFIGLDTCYSILKVLHDGLGDPKYRPCPLLRKYVEAGHLGKKSGQGVFLYR